MRKIYTLKQTTYLAVLQISRLIRFFFLVPPVDSWLFWVYLMRDAHNQMLLSCYRLFDETMYLLHGKCSANSV